MDLIRGLPWLGLPIVMAFNVGSYAAKPMKLQHYSFDEVQKKFYQPASGLKVSAPPRVNDLKFLNQHIDRKKNAHIRMQQLYYGIPVFNGQVIFHSPRDVHHLWSGTTEDRVVTGVLYDGLESDLGKPDADLVDKGQDALEAFKSQYAQQVLSEASVEPMIYIDEDHRAHWTYRVSVLITLGDKIPERPTALLDAKTYHPYLQWNEVKTGKSLVKARGFGGNLHVGLYQYGQL